MACSMMRLSTLCEQRKLLPLLCLVSLFPSATGRAEFVTLKNGMQFEGRVGKIASLGDDPLSPQGAAGQIKIKQIILVDDDLRRVFFSSMQTQGIVPKQTNLERIRINQRVAKSNRRVGSVGQFSRVTEFDEWGRRIVTMGTGDGAVDIVQGITEVTPTYTKLEGLSARNSYVWDYRMSTSSIPRDVLSKILLRQIDPKDPDNRLRLVRLYIQAERYKDARVELESVIKDFPALANLETQVKALYQLSARRLIKEIEQRRDAGQHRLAYAMLDRFPSEGVAGEILLQARDMLDEYAELQKRGQAMKDSLQVNFGAVQDAGTKAQIQPAVEEILADLSINTFDRMADYMRLADDPNMSVEQKASLAVSGWLLGSGAGTENLAVASSLYQVRTLIRQYLNSQHQYERDEILARLQTLEGSSPAYLARILANMKPGVKSSWSEEDPPGYFQLSAPGLSGEPDISYLVQLPPEYDPYRSYPCIITLNGAGTTPRQQLDWWAGAYSPEAKMRLGQGTRHGYIVVSPVWSRPHQIEYEYSAREHAAVLFSLRDACRRFSIDTDRVFLSGHSMGGDAVWDIGLAHPDLWAGVIPIVPTADKYIARYWQNAKYASFYFVMGEMDGDRLARNSQDLDRYLTHNGYDTIVVVYQGRGHEHFYDEIQSLFDWMELHKRDFTQKEFECVSMRPWDNFFWWAEVRDMPSRTQVLPVNWPPESGVRPAETTGRILENNRVSLDPGGTGATIWLTPDMVDFSQRVSVSIDGKTYRDPLEPSAAVLLEDVRTRGDRQHPFWAKVEHSPGR